MGSISKMLSDAIFAMGGRPDQIMSGSNELTNLQVLRLKDKYPFAYTIYADHGDLSVVREYIDDIKRKFPEAPHIPCVYYDARGNAVYWSSYLKRWSIRGDYEGESVAWAYYDDKLYILHFEDNIFDVGVRLYEPAISQLVRFYETGEEESPCIMHGVAFKCGIERSKYVIRMDGIKIMELSDEFMASILTSVGDDSSVLELEFSMMVSSLYPKEGTYGN